MRTPIQYPTADPYASLRAGWQHGIDHVRDVGQRRREVLARLRTQFHQINARCFDGKLPTPAFEMSDDLGENVAAHCHVSPARAWSQPYTIRFSRRNIDNPKALSRFLAHEVAHLAGFAVDEWYEVDHHGARFDAIHDAIKRGVRYEGDTGAPASPSQPSAASRSSGSSPVTMRRGDGGEVVSRVTATFTRPTRTGRQNLYVLRGQKVEADHWAVAHSPGSFAKVPA